MILVLLASCNSSELVGGQLVSFKKIEINGVNESPTYDPEGEKSLCNVYFELSFYLQTSGCKSLKKKIPFLDMKGGVYGSTEGTL
jgi:hypothetical protein